jgi:hypothetical protein
MVKNNEERLNETLAGDTDAKPSWWFRVLRFPELHKPSSGPPHP